MSLTRLNISFPNLPRVDTDLAAVPLLAHLSALSSQVSRKQVMDLLNVPSALSPVIILLRTSNPSVNTKVYLTERSIPGHADLLHFILMVRV